MLSLCIRVGARSGGRAALSRAAMVGSSRLLSFPSRSSPPQRAAPACALLPRPSALALLQQPPPPIDASARRWNITRPSRWHPKTYPVPSGRSRRARGLPKKLKTNRAAAQRFKLRGDGCAAPQDARSPPSLTLRTALRPRRAAVRLFSLRFRPFLPMHPHGSSFVRTFTHKAAGKAHLQAGERRRATLAKKAPRVVTHKGLAKKLRRLLPYA